MQVAFIQNFGTQELILIFLVVLLFFGAKRMPELFRSFGKSIKEFKKATSDVQDDIRTAMETDIESPRVSEEVRSKEIQPATEANEHTNRENSKNKNSSL